MKQLAALFAIATIVGGCGGTRSTQPGHEVCGTVKNQVQTFRVYAYGVPCRVAKRAVMGDVAGRYWFDDLRTERLGAEQKAVASPVPTQAELQAHTRVLARLKAKEAKARAAARAAARARARARAAAIARANAWHSGYELYDYGDGIYYQWLHNYSCSSYVDYCWHMKVITRNGCTSLFVEANEIENGAIVGDLIASHDNVPPKTPALFELVGTSGSTSSVASAPTITCNHY